MQYYFMIFYYLLGATVHCVQLRFSYSRKEQFRYSNASKSVQPTTNGKCKFDRFFSATTQNKKTTIFVIFYVKRSIAQTNEKICLWKFLSLLVPFGEFSWTNRLKIWLVLKSVLYCVCWSGFEPELLTAGPPQLWTNEAKQPEPDGQPVQHHPHHGGPHSQVRL